MENYLYIENPKYNNLNESIDFKRKFIYVAVPKTGSSSIREQLKTKPPYFISDPHLTLEQIRDLIYPYLLSCNLGRNYKFPTDAVLPPGGQKSYLK